ncbi:MAG TPA: hypothetical protein VMM13_02225, partial [Euzebya sp.]|nr:hypothetical protein [Euzebya sp.]
PRESLAKLARTAGVKVHMGRWPQIAATVGRAPVVLSTHVMYDIQQPTPFLQAMHAAAQRRVVIEVTQAHPWAHLGPLYQRFHDLDRPTGPTAADLAAVITQATAITPQTHPWTRNGSTYDSVTALADQTARMLCLPPDPEVIEELEELVAAAGTVLPDGRIRLADAMVVTLWWDTDG